MSVIEWDRIEDRVYETGVDRGVLYLPSGAAVPWNGLVSVSEVVDKEVSPVYFDGMKIADSVTLGDYQATVQAITYPEEMTELEGLVSLRPGFYASDQQPQLFGLSYRTLIGDATQGPDAGYKIHIIYNAMATPSDREYSTLSDSPSIAEFEWTITATPEEVQGIRPTAHLIFSSLELSPTLLQILEDMLYGTPDSAPYLMPMVDLVNFVSTWAEIIIMDLGDGTWSATDDGTHITMLTPDTFQIDDANATYLDLETYTISSGTSEDIE